MSGESQPIPAVVLAGGRTKPDMQIATGASQRALVPVNGRPMLDFVVDALLAATQVSKVVVVGDVPERTGCVHVADHGGFVENIFAGLDVAPDSEYAALVTSDIPYLTPEAVDDLLARAVATEADMADPVVRVAECYARFPGVKRTALRLREGEFTGGNITVVRASFMRSRRNRLAQAYSYRKSPLKLAALLGPGVILRFAAAKTVSHRALTIERLEAAVSRLIGGSARAVVSRYPELATDIDRPSDLEAIRTIPPGSGEGATDGAGDRR